MVQHLPGRRQGALVFIRQGSQTQIALGCLICIAAALVFALQWPYATFRDNALGIMSHCQLTGTLFSAMMYKLGKNAELAYDREATGWLLIALNGTVFLIMLGWVAFEVLVDEGPSLRSRERQFLAQASFLLSGGSVRGRFMADGATVEEHHEEKRRKSTMPVQMSTLTVGSGGTGDGEIGLRSQESVEVELTDMYGRGSSGSSVAYTDNPMQGGAGGRGEAAKPAPKLSPGSGVSSRRNLMGRLKLAGSTASLKSGSRRGLFGGASSARSLADVKERGSSSASSSSLASKGPSAGDPPSGRGSLERRSEADAPDGWSKEFDDASQSYYYWNLETGETAWEVPRA